MKLQNEFQPIREWAAERGIYRDGDRKTQLIKLMEEVGELSQGILKNNEYDIRDAIGDCVVVLTNLAALCGTNIEQCTNDAFTVIESRTGKMVNGTFKKD